MYILKTSVISLLKLWDIFCETVMNLSISKEILDVKFKKLRRGKNFLISFKRRKVEEYSGKLGAI